ncbi:TMV resistance protein N-like [Neltuma alba]|uniref:TMV resistance protein N-like n=1 Tax=Neltuma alba TaxID=207710 RepID=UPI0010A3FB92|nr:TMV resistance protein N-like [Prosopis alba]
MNRTKLEFLEFGGKGGIGKTSLARAAFGNFYHQFDRSCFAENVREKSKTIGTNCLLEKILSVLLDEEKLTMVGMPNVQRRLRRTRVLLVLDDVDTLLQLKYLIEENLSLGPGSKVIITSRDKHVLISGGAHEVHEVKELNKEESLQLFCRHAFKQGHPKQGYEKLSMQVIEYAKGLPLASKVLGSYLNSRNTKAWESALKKLRNGEKKEDIIQVLDACDDDLYVDIGIDRLLDKALITISSHSRVEIHDMLQEMAEEIVREESREHPESRSRLNDAKEIQDVPENNKGTDTIEGIALNPDELESNIHLSADAFKKMNKLVEIQMPWSKVVKLWDGVQNLMNLKMINLSSSYELEELPDFSMAQDLEIMDLSYCKGLCRIHPSILSLPKLVSLNLAGCIELKNPHGDNHLKSLKELKLMLCPALKEFLLSAEEMRSLHVKSKGIKKPILPVDRLLSFPFGWFNNLEELCLNRLLRSFQVNELGSLTSLKVFSLDGFKGKLDKSKLVILFDALPSLEELYLTYCRIRQIPDNISAMSLLKILSLQGSSVMGLPDSIKHLSELREIDLGKCKMLRSLPELPPSLAYCYLNECQSLETFGFSLMRAIHNSSELRFCYPGSTIPGGFKFSQTTKGSISIKLAPGSSHHLLGFASCCIISPSRLKSLPLVGRKFHYEDEEIYYKVDDKLSRHEFWSTNHVLLWYDLVDRMLKENQRRRFDEGANCEFACEFFHRSFVGPHVAKYNNRIKGCGIWPIHASELQGKMELRLEMDAVTDSTSQHPNAEVSQHQPARDSVRRSTCVRQRTGNLTTLPYSESQEMPK